MFFSIDVSNSFDEFKERFLKTVGHNLSILHMKAIPWLHEPQIMGYILQMEEIKSRAVIDLQYSLLLMVFKTFLPTWPSCIWLKPWMK